MGWLDNWRKLDPTKLELEKAGTKSLGHACICWKILDKSHGRRLKLYAEVLQDEVFKRSKTMWEVLECSETTADDQSKDLVELTLDSNLQGRLGAEGYKIKVESYESGRVLVKVTATAERGVLFGVGRLLREMSLDFHISYAEPLVSLCAVPLNLDIESKPQYRMRQHQIAYRPKTNSYDGFTPEMMCQEILDLALFGTNAIELIPPGIDDALQSPNFSIPWLDMMEVVSNYCDRLDINISIWYPAFFKDYNDASMLEQAEEHWATIFGSLKRLNVLFVPGGDPGGRPAKDFFEAVEKQAAFLRKHHFPQCEVWVSSQYGLSMSVDLGITEPWKPLEAEKDWMDMLETPKVQAFLDGVVYGPWSAVPISEFRAQVPQCFPLRNYPDLCHVQTAEMPVNSWDLSFAVTNGRESINPRPREMLTVILEQAPYTIGCGCYSEGVNDDVNKYVFTALHWGADLKGPLENADPEAVLSSVLLHYASFLVNQPRQANRVVEGILALEQNWRGDLFSSLSVPRSQEIFTELQNHLSPRHRRNWRLNLLLFRARHDALLYARIRQCRLAESRAVHALIADGMSLAAVHFARTQLSIPYVEPNMAQSSFKSPSTPNPFNVTKLASNPSITHQYGQLMALAATLYHLIGYQLSVGYGGQHRQRGAYLDLIWTPLGDAAYIGRMLKLMESTAISNSNGSVPERELKLMQRFKFSIDDYMGLSKQQVLWYASFGDIKAHPVPGMTDPPQRPIPVHDVVQPYRPVPVGEDPVYFNRPMIEYLDCSNDDILRDLHDGLIPRAWRSFLEPIWPRTSGVSLRFGVNRLFAHCTSNPPVSLKVRITYLGADLNRHGGDWEELGREAMPVRLCCNGVMVHDFFPVPELTETREYHIPEEGCNKALSVGTMILTFEPETPDKTTFRYVPIPIAELWILAPSDNISHL